MRVHGFLCLCCLHQSLTDCNFFNKRGRGSLRVGSRPVPEPRTVFRKPGEVMDNEGGQYQRVKAFEDKPRLMTRKSEVALICTDPLAHWSKAVCYTKETPNLLRDMLNIPLLLGEKEPSISPSVLFMGAIQNSLQACVLFYCWFLRENQRDHDGERERAVGWRVGCWMDEGLFWSHGWMLCAKLELAFWCVLERCRHQSLASHNWSSPYRGNVDFILEVEVVTLQSAIVFTS